MAEEKLKVKDLAICLMLDLFESIPTVGDIASIIHGIWLYRKGEKLQALLVSGNVNPLPFNIGNLLAYLITGRLPL